MDKCNRRVWMKRLYGRNTSLTKKLTRQNHTPQLRLAEASLAARLEPQGQLPPLPRVEGSRYMGLPVRRLEHKSYHERARTSQEEAVNRILHKLNRMSLRPWGRRTEELLASKTTQLHSLEMSRKMEKITGVMIHLSLQRKKKTWSCL